jgi:PKD repeat protein
MSILKIIFTGTFVLIFNLNYTTAQTTSNWCGQVFMDAKYQNDHPSELQGIINAEQQLEQEYLSVNQRNSRAIKVIPVVFHVIHQNGSENISEAQIQDQMRILNEDYNKKNTDLIDVVSSFVNVIGDAGIEFRLAQLDPSGNPTNGIDRIVSNLTNQGGDNAKLNPWPRKSYLNIWIVKNWNSSIPNGVLAYAYRPASVQGNPNVDGIIVLSQYVGSIGTSSPTYARTLTHEIGHYLNLLHTWGSTNNPGVSTNCNDDDGVSDTPNCIGTFTCNTSSQSCGSLDNIQNHMDYSECTVMFTVGQSNKMITALNTSVAERNNLSTPSNLTTTGVNQLTIANFKANRVTICQHETIDFTDISQYDPTSWTWTFPNGASGSSNLRNPSEKYTDPGLYDVSLTAQNTSTSINKTKVGYIMVNPSLGKFAPFTEDFSSVNQLNHEDWYGVNDQDNAYQFVADPDHGYSNSNCLRIENFGNETKSKDELRSTTYDLRMFSSVNVTFKIAYAQKTISDISKLTLYISNDCGKSWTPRWSAIGPTMANAPVTSTYYTPSGTQDWKTITVSSITGPLLSQTSQLRFVFENKNGNNLYIDDVNVGGSYSNIAQLKYPFDGTTSVPNTQGIYWKATGNGVDSYEYQLNTDANFNSGNLQTGTKSFISIQDGPDTEFTPSTLLNGQKYYWRVRLIKNGQPQPWSDIWNFTVAVNGVSTQDLLRQTYSVKVFPNPIHSNGFLSFELNDGKNVQINVTNVIGKTYVISNEKYYGSGTHLFNLSQIKLSPGLYVLNIKIQGETLHKKFVVQ